jgi:hypothetical protein
VEDGLGHGRVTGELHVLHLERHIAEYDIRTLLQVGLDRCLDSVFGVEIIGSAATVPSEH